MYKIIGNLLFLALFASASAFTTANPAAGRLAESNGISAPDFILTLAAGQIAPGTAKAVWSASNDGPYTVVVEDVSTNQIVYTNVTYDDFDIIAGLQPGKYTVTVSDPGNALVADFSIQ